VSQATEYAISTKNSVTGTGSDSTLAFAERGNLDTTTNLNTAGATEVPFDGAFFTSGTGWAINGNGIELTGPNSNVRIGFNLHVTSSNNRTNLLAQIALDGTPIGPIAASGYIRNATGHNESSLAIPGFWLPVTTGQVITVVTLREAGAGTVTMALANTSILVLERLINV